LHGCGMIAFRLPLQNPQPMERRRLADMIATSSM
jgi:hypothetical protein